MKLSTPFTPHVRGAAAVVVAGSSIVLVFDDDGSKLAVVDRWVVSIVEVSTADVVVSMVIAATVDSIDDVVASFTFEEAVLVIDSSAVVARPGMILRPLSTSRAASRLGTIS
jgi:hypothetical protein